MQAIRNVNVHKVFSALSFLFSSHIEDARVRSHAHKAFDQGHFSLSLSLPLAFGGCHV